MAMAVSAAILLQMSVILWSATMKPWKKKSVAVERTAIQGFLDDQHGIQHPAARCQIPLCLCCQEHAMDHVQPSCILNTKQISNLASWAIAHSGSYIPSYVTLVYCGYPSLKWRCCALLLHAARIPPQTLPHSFQYLKLSVAHLCFMTELIGAK